MSLFEKGHFVGASGNQMSFKIECDALTADDIECIAFLMFNATEKFSEVYGVPTGGLRIAEALKRYRTPGARTVLFVDDVWTTGGSMEKCIQSTEIEGGLAIRGSVIFARSASLPWWLSPLFVSKVG